MSVLSPEARNNAVQAPVWRIDRRLSSEEKHIVQESAKDASKERSNHGHPEVIVAGSPHLRAIPDHVGNQSRTKVPGKINRIASFPTKASTNTEDDEEESKWSQLFSSDVMVVLDGIDQEHQQHRGDEFREELASGGHELLGVGAEYPGCGISGLGVTWNSADAISLKLIDGRSVVAIYNSGCQHSTKDLRDEIHRKLAPGELAEDAVGECHGRIYMGA